MRSINSHDMRVKANHPTRIKKLRFLNSNLATQEQGDQNMCEDYQQGLKVPIDTGQSEKGAETPIDKDQRLAL